MEIFLWDSSHTKFNRSTATNLPIHIAYSTESIFNAGAFYYKSYLTSEEHDSISWRNGGRGRPNELAVVNEGESPPGRASQLLASFMKSVSYLTIMASSVLWKRFEQARLDHVVRSQSLHFAGETARPSSLDWLTRLNMRR